MKSIKANFLKNERQDPESSSLINFARTIIGKKFNEEILIKNFYKLVDKNDYEDSNKKEVLAWLKEVSKGLEESAKVGGQGDLSPIKSKR